MTTLTAAQRRAILANAHATYLASHHPVAATANLGQALKQTDMIGVADTVTEVQLDGTTVRVFVDCDDWIEVLELNAYGNVLRGTV